MKPYQERLITLLKDTITLLCRNGLEYDQEFCVEGLLGVTLDKNDVFLIPIKELITDKGVGTDIPTLEEDKGRTSDTDVTTESTLSKSERRKRRRQRALAAAAGEDTGGGDDGDGNTTQNNWLSQDDKPRVTHENEEIGSRDSNVDESPRKRKRHEDAPDIKSEDVVFIKEEVDDAEFASAFQDGSMDSSHAQNRDGNIDFFSQPGTSQSQLGFPLDQLQATAGSGLSGAMQEMSPTDADGSWLQGQGDLTDMQHSQQGDWQQQKHQCDVCGKRFDRKYDMNRHRAALHLKVRYKCDICSKVYSRRDHAIHHRKKAHTH